MDRIVGREPELERVCSFVGEAAGAGVLVVEGEAGIGKTTLWLAGVEAAAETGALVLRARPVEAEAKLSFSGLCDLLGDHAEEAMTRLPEPQRRALEVALMLEAPVGGAPVAPATAVAVLSVIRALSRERRVVVAIDDVQWLDAPSGAAVGYAARRLAREPVRFLFALRREPGGVVPAALEPLGRDEGLTWLAVGPLSLSATQRLLHTRLGIVLARPVLRRLHEAASGNPFMALELARAVAAAGEPPAPGEPLPASDEMRELVRGRLAGLAPEVFDVLLAAAMLAAPSVERLEAAVPAASGALRSALGARLVALEGERVRFAHPLFAAGVVELAGERRRREMHRRLADVVEDGEERALHLALSAEDPDDGVAAVLDDAAGAAAARGAPEAAADLLERAWRLTPPERSEERERRRLDASMHYWIATDQARAAALLEDAVASLAPGPHRARALARLARLREHAALPREALELDRRAIAEPGHDLQARAEAHENIAWTLLFQRRELRAAARHARAGVALAEAWGDPAELMDANSALGQIEFLLGGGLPSAAMERALELARHVPETRSLRLATVHAALLLLCADRLDEARTGYEQARRYAVARGDEWGVSWLCMRLALVDCLAGRWARARQEVEQGLALTDDASRWLSRVGLVAMRALVAAVQGDAELARETGSEAAEQASAESVGIALQPALWALGLVELSLGDARAAEQHLARLWELAEDAGIADPGERRFAGDLIETWLALGRTDDALRPIEWLERRGRELGRPSALAVAARGRGLLAARAGEPGDAVAHFDRALAEHARAPLPFEHARTRLALGGVLRRAGRKRDARASLTEARAAFHELGAALWAARAEDELRRISGRAPGPRALTPAEQRVAALVAEGRTNREVAAALFVSERTVESHLSHVYGKLGLRSRTELAGRYGDSE